jgi:hypothetical protein
LTHGGAFGVGAGGVGGGIGEGGVGGGGGEGGVACCCGVVEYGGNCVCGGDDVMPPITRFILEGSKLETKLHGELTKVGIQ